MSNIFGRYVVDRDGMRNSSIPKKFISEIKTHIFLSSIGDIKKTKFKFQRH